MATNQTFKYDYKSSNQKQKYARRKNNSFIFLKINIFDNDKYFLYVWIKKLMELDWEYSWMFNKFSHIMFAQDKQELCCHGCNILIWVCEERD